MKSQSLPNIRHRIWAVLIVIGHTEIILSCQNTRDKAESTEVITKTIFPLKEIAGCTKDEVNKKLGKGTFAFNWKDRRAGCTKCPKYFYKGDSIEVIYINGKADRITLNNLSNHNFDESFITLLGLPAAKPDFSNSTVMRWYNYKRFREVMVFEDGKGGILYALVKIKAD